jgi:membrane fusion protein, multidrug efflux system
VKVPFMRAKLGYWAVAVVGIAALSGGAWWYQTRTTGPTEMRGAGASAPAGALRAAGVEVAQVQTMTLQDGVQSVGSLRSRQSVMVRPEVAGRVKVLGFKDGASVRKGQLLVQLDDILQRAELSQAKAQAAIAQSSFKRNQELVAQNFVAQRVLDESSAALQVAQAQVALAEARLARMAIVAPFDGTVGLRNVNVGDYVKDGADLVNLEDTSTLLVDFRVPERFAQKLKLQQVVELTLDAVAGRKFTAKIEALDPLLDANGRSVGVRAALPNNPPTQGESPLRPGMFARVSTIFGSNAAALVVPEEALVPQAGKQFVFLVVPVGTVPAAGELPADTRFVSQRREVKLGSRMQGKVEVTEGLEQGQTIVVAGQQRLQRDGSPLKVIELGKPAGAAPATAAASAPAAAASR